MEAERVAGGRVVAALAALGRLAPEVRGQHVSLEHVHARPPHRAQRAQRAAVVQPRNDLRRPLDSSLSCCGVIELGKAIRSPSPLRSSEIFEESFALR